MGSDIIPGTDGAVRFPTERRMEATLLDVEMLAPREDLALAMADEIAQTQDRRHWIDVGGTPDVRTETAEAFLALFGALEFGMGREAALASLRKLVAVQVEQAHALCQAYRDAEAEAEDALGARTALDVVEQGTSWRHVPRGEEDDWLCSVAELRERRRRRQEKPSDPS